MEFMHELDTNFAGMLTSIKKAGEHNTKKSKYNTKKSSRYSGSASASASVPVQDQVKEVIEYDDFDNEYK
jgi:hypothetical protein